MSSLKNLAAKSRERFGCDTSEHVMEVLHDDGLYRHLRFKKPGTSAYYFDIVTWPGCLTVTGDCGTFVFARITDMVEFFAPKEGSRGGFEDERWGINPQYWAEKLRAPTHSDAQQFSEEIFKASALEWFDEAAKELEPDEATSLREALEDQVLAVRFPTEQDAHQLVQEFEHHGIRIHDSWEWSFREYRWDFLWCCWAIVWGVGKYLERP